MKGVKNSSSRTKFKIKGLNQERLINKIVQEINIYNFNRESHEICNFEIDTKKEKYVKKLLDENGIEVISISHYGFLSKLKSIVASYGIIFALVISTIFYAFQYSFIWKIEIYGEASVEEREIEYFVNSILSSKFKADINTKEMERKIKENFQEISSISVAIVGQTLVLNLNEAILPEEMEGEYKPLISSFDGLVTEINLIQGTLVVNKGDIVRKGDVLVYPYVIDSQGDERAVAPKAEIYADIWISEKIMHYDYQIIVQRTGREISTNQVLLNNLLIYSQRKINDFEQFEIEEEEKLLSKNLIIPFILKKTTYYETETIEIKEEFDNVKEKIIASTREKTLIFLEENEIIKEENVTIREEGGCHEVCYVITLNRNIGG